tara:strand:+ start:128 stop:712 length:585 start_codon:yes stop_codon:yes gene_type:complete
MKIFPKEYKCLKQQNFKLEEFQIIPIRYEDRYKIMNWRNDQIYHLRQDKILTKKDQDKYFLKVVSKLFLENYPKQILFSYLRKNKLIGYGGIVNIDWNKKTAEMSFLVNTDISGDFKEYHESLTSFIKLIKIVVFNHLSFIRLFTETYDMRDFHINILEQNMFLFEKRIKRKYFYKNKEYDSLIHYISNESLNI